MNIQSGAGRGDTDDTYEGRALVAVFSDRDVARDAVSRLHDEGFRDVWLGVTHAREALADDSTSGAGRTAVEGGSESLGARIGRFFSGESDEVGLVDALTRRGVAESEATRIDRSIAPNCAILTVDGSNHPELAANIIEECGGHILAGESFAGAESARAAGENVKGSQVLGYNAPTEYARGQKIDEQRRIALRGERLNVDKQRISTGEAAVRKEVVETQQSVDVPTVREELFVERRPLAEATGAEDTTPIGEGESIRIPLTRERIVVTKRPVVTEEFVVGKRQVAETEHVSETLRQEKLRVDDGSSARVPGTAGADTAP